jgi:hypothetical protein
MELDHTFATGKRVLITAREDTRIMSNEPTKS